MHRLAELIAPLGYECAIRQETYTSLGSSRGWLVAWHSKNACFVTAHPLENQRWRVCFLDDGATPQARVSTEQLAASLGVEEGSPIFVGYLQDRLGLRQLAGTQDKRPHPLRRFWKWLHLERRDAVAIVVYAVAVGILTLAVPVAVQALIDIVAFGTLMQPIVVLGILLLGALCLAGGLCVAQMILIEMIGRRFFMKAMQDFGTRFMRAQRSKQPYADYRALGNRVFDAATIEKSLPRIVVDGLGATLQLVVGLLVLALYHPWFLVFAAILAVGMGTLLRLTWKRGEQTALDESKQKHALASWMHGLVSAFPTVRSAQGHDLARSRLDKEVLGWHAKRRSHFAIHLTGAEYRFYGASDFRQRYAPGGWRRVSERDVELSQLAHAKAMAAVNKAKAAVSEAQSQITSLKAERYQKAAEADAGIAAALASQQETQAKEAYAKTEIAKIDVELGRQASRLVSAPRSGTILNAVGSEGGKVVKTGAHLARLVPDSGQPAVEIWIDGNDAPLITEGRSVRLQFEGWPAVQFAGWPSVAVGTFPARVLVVDAMARQGIFDLKISASAGTDPQGFYERTFAEGAVEQLLPVYGLRLKAGYRKGRDFAPYEGRAWTSSEGEGAVQLRAQEV